MRAKKTDANHKAVLDHLRAIGWSVFDSSAFGRGMGDALVSRFGHSAVVEIKFGAGEPNELQRKFRDKWQGAYFIVRSPEDAEKQLSAWLLAQVAWKR